MGGGQAARYGVREDDKILTINGKTPRNVDDAVGVIKQAGNQIKLVVLRAEDVPGNPDITIEEQERQSVGSGGEIDSRWQMRDSLGGQQAPISRSGSARSFNTSYGRPPASPSPRPPRAQFGQPAQSASLPGHAQGGHNQSFQQQEFLRQQQEYKRQQEFQRQQELQRQQEQQQQALLAQQAAQQAQQRQREYQAQQQAQQQAHSVKDTVRDIIANTDFSAIMDQTRPKSSGAMYPPNSRVIQETKRSTENITRIVETIPQSQGKYKSTQSLHELGLDNYPNPEMPESSRLSRKEEKQSLQNLNNRLAGYIDRVRSLQQENYRLTKQVKVFESHQTTEVNNVKEMFNKQIDDLKSALDNMNKQYNQLKIGAEGLLQENEEIKNKMKKKDADAALANERMRNLEDEMRQMANQLSLLDAEKSKLSSQLQDALPEVQVLRDKLADAKRALDDEQLKSADLENNCARLEEDLKFKLQLLEKELHDVKIRKTVEIEEMDGKLQEEYEDRLQKALEELREVYDSKMKQSRGNSASTQQELKESKGRIAALISKVSDLEGANLALNQKIADLAQEMEDLKGIHRAQLAAKDDEIKRLLDELANQLKEYQNLQDIKIALDMEIAVFRRLIETEEDRLGLGDKSMDMSDSSVSTHSRTPPARTSVERTTESSYQKKITVSQTQL